MFLDPRCRYTEVPSFRTGSASTACRSLVLRDVSTDPGSAFCPVHELGYDVVGPDAERFGRDPVERRLDDGRPGGVVDAEEAKLYIALLSQQLRSHFPGTSSLKGIAASPQKDSFPLHLVRSITMQRSSIGSRAKGNGPVYTFIRLNFIIVSVTYD